MKPLLIWRTCRAASPTPACFEFHRIIRSSIGQRNFVFSSGSGREQCTRFPIYTDIMKNVTISLDEELARWARRKAADEDISVSKLIARMLDRERRASDSYWRAYEEWKKLDFRLDASKRMTREEAHER